MRIMTLVTREIHLDSPEYERAWTLRRAVLLTPYGIDCDAARADDHAALHFGVFDGARCVACLFLVALDKDLVKMRQVAVTTEYQRRGLGRQLVSHAESVAIDHGFVEMIAHAREQAVPFYAALGYQIVGEGFEEVKIPHFLVKKVLHR